MVRARAKVHLHRETPAFARQSPARATPTANYPYRIIVPKALWANLLSDLALEQTWSNFKKEVAAFQGEGGSEPMGPKCELVCLGSISEPET